MKRSSRGIPSKEYYMDALTQMLNEGAIPESHMLMLRAHFQAPEGIVSTKDLANAAGYASCKPVNLQYGRLGTRMRQFMGKDGRTLGGQQSHIIADFLPPGVFDEYWRWLMHEPLKEAIEELGWFQGCHLSHCCIVKAYAVYWVRATRQSLAVRDEGC